MATLPRVGQPQRCQGTLDGPPRAHGLGEPAFGRSSWGMDDEVFASLKMGYTGYTRKRPSYWG